MFGNVFSLVLTVSVSHDLSFRFCSCGGAFFHEIVERVLEFMESVEKLATRDILTALGNAMLPKAIYI